MEEFRTLFLSRFCLRNLQSQLKKLMEDSLKYWRRRVPTTLMIETMDTIMDLTATVTTITQPHSHQFLGFWTLNRNTKISHTQMATITTEQPRDFLSICCQQHRQQLLLHFPSTSFKHRQQNRHFQWTCSSQQLLGHFLWTFWDKILFFIRFQQKLIYWFSATWCLW